MYICEVWGMNLKLVQWHTSADAGHKNLLGQWLGTNSSVRKL